MSTKGTVKAVPCPWCGEHNTDIYGVFENGIVTQNAILECDFCENRYELTSVFEVTHVVAERFGDMLHGDYLKR